MIFLNHFEFNTDYFIEEKISFGHLINRILHYSMHFLNRWGKSVERWRMGELLNLYPFGKHSRRVHREKLDALLEEMDEVLVIVIKIEDFETLRHYLDYQALLEMEQTFVEELLYLIPKGCAFSSIYPLGSGEFVLVKPSSEMIGSQVEQNIRQLQKIINHAKIEVKDIDYELSVIMSVAYGKNALCDAQIGLQEIIKSHRCFIIANGLQDLLRASSKKRIETLKMIEKAITSSRVLSYFQPIVNNQTQVIEKYESLIRIQNEEGKLLSPAGFFEISQNSKYHIRLMTIVLENSFAALYQTSCDISLNLSMRDIEKKPIRERFLALIQEHHQEAHRIIWELLEDKEGEQLDLIHDFITQIKSYGVKIAIDDFGVGYSNFERVMNYNPDFLKIDGELIRNIHTNPRSYSIVETIVSFAKKEQLKVIAEFVESEVIYQTLCDIGVEYSQGYYFGKPDRLLS